LFLHVTVDLERVGAHHYDRAALRIAGPPLRIPLEPLLKELVLAMPHPQVIAGLGDWPLVSLLGDDGSPIVPRLLGVTARGPEGSAE
jgi:hypothetical protein